MVMLTVFLDHTAYSVIVSSLTPDPMSVTVSPSVKWTVPPEEMAHPRNWRSPLVN